MATAEEKAAIAKKRGAAAAQISDPDQKQKFIAAQGEAEKKGTADYEKLDREADDTIATGGQNKAVGLPSYKHGTPHVPATGPAMLHKGEAVIPADQNMFAMIPGMPAQKPKKEIDHIRIRRAKSGGHVIEHHHTAPADHKMEEHVTASMDALHKHLSEHMV